MAFTDVPGNRKIAWAVCPVKVTLAEAVNAGDPLGISGGTWVLSADAAAEQPLLVAGEKGAVGATIVAYPLCLVEVTHTAANKPTIGEKIALTDAGAYAPAGAGLPDVGFVISTAADELTSIVLVSPLCAQLTVVRS